MRRLLKPKRLNLVVRRRLESQTALIAAAVDRVAEAERLYTNARKTVWFSPVVESLKKSAGRGARCMVCSGSEASDVEHYRPKNIFPLLAMNTDNYLWSCTPCNRSKGKRFPPDTAPGAMLLNPLAEDVWQYFFIDKYGFITPIFDRAVNGFNLRAEKTEDHWSLNRESLQVTRLARLKQLRGEVRLLTKLVKGGSVNVDQANRKIRKWRSLPFQPDVADYFLAGPGMKTAPFKALFQLL